MHPEWERRIAVLAVVFHFSASELLSMDADDVAFWMDQAEWVRKNGG